MKTANDTFKEFIDSLKKETSEQGTVFSLCVNGTTIDLGGRIILVSTPKESAWEFKPGRVWDNKSKPKLKMLYIDESDKDDDNTNTKEGD